MKTPRHKSVGKSSVCDADQIRALAGLLNELGLAEIELETHGERVRLRLGLDADAPRVAAEPKTVESAPTPPPIPAAPALEGSYVTSPFVGTFYRASSPDSPPYVEVGQSIKKGQVLCIVEAMKLMNEIESEVDGRVLEILVANGEPVEYGEPLFKIGSA